MQELKKSTEMVTVFLPYYNDSKFLHNTIQSILNQSYTDFTLILFNHASTDESRDIARSFFDKRIIHIDSEINLGAGSGLNLVKSLPWISGKYLKLFCADDIMEPNCLEELVSYLETNLDKDFVFSNASFINESGTKSVKTWFDERTSAGLSFECDEKEILRLLLIRHSPLCFSASLIKTKDLYEIDINKVAILLFDVHLWGSLLVKGKKIGFINKSLISYMVHEKQVSMDAKMFLGTQEFHNMNRHFLISFFETIKIQNIFYKINNIDIVKYLCKDSPFVMKLNDPELIPFVIAHYFLNISCYPGNLPGFHSALILNGYLKIFDLMQDDAMRIKIENTFNYGIKEFRESYSEQDIYLNSYFEFELHNLKKKLSILEGIRNSRTFRWGERIVVFLRKIFPRNSMRTHVLKSIFSFFRIKL